MVALDLSDPAFLQDPCPVLNALRTAAPLHYDDASGLWLVTRYDDVRNP
jgi:cytochrome P450